jgi:hypothetical protein
MRTLSSARVGWITGLLAALLTFTAVDQAYAYPAVWSLGVPNKAQLQSNWCWAGTGQSCRCSG